MDADLDDFDLDEMIRAVWEETHQPDCCKLAEIIMPRIPARVVAEVLTDLIGNQCFSLLSGEGKPVHRIDPEIMQALETLGEGEREKRAAYADLIAIINAEPATSFHQVWFDTHEADPGKAAQVILTRMSEDARRLLDQEGVTEGVLEAIAEGYSAFLAQMT
jgi:hypothetical protein